MGVSLLSHCLMTWMLWGYPHFRKPLFGGFFKFIGDLVGDDTHAGPWHGGFKYERERDSYELIE